MDLADYPALRRVLDRDALADLERLIREVIRDERERESRERTRRNLEMRRHS